MLHGNTEIYTTPDLTQGAFLVAKNIKLIGSRREGGRTFFLFEAGSKTEESISQYFSNASVAIGDFRRAWQDLKNIIYSPRGGID